MADLYTRSHETIRRPKNMASVKKRLFSSYQDRSVRTCSCFDVILLNVPKNFEESFNIILYLLFIIFSPLFNVSDIFE